MATKTPDRRSAAAAVFVTLVLLAGGCSGDDEAEPASSPSATPVFSAYQEFFDRCIGVEAIEVRIGDVTSELQSPGLKEDRTNELESEKARLEKDRTQQIEEYNTAANEYSETELEDAGLPYQLEEEGLAICATA